MDLITKVLVVDDSHTSRMQLVSILSADGEIRVVGEAANGKEAVRMVSELNPDVVTMDINMPVMNGIDATKVIMSTRPVPILVISSILKPDEVSMTFEALKYGAVVALGKPHGMGSSQFKDDSTSLVRNVKLFAGVKVVRRRRPPEKEKVVPVRLPRVVEAGPLPDIRIVAIGCSTGGPSAVQALLAGLPVDFPLPIVMVQHIAPGFLPGFTSWLGKTTPFPIHIAANGEKVQPGHVYVAPDDFHCAVSKQGLIRLSTSAPEKLMRPAISHLFRSISMAYGKHCIGILLTGMGKDGTQELREMKDNGAVTLVQDEKSSVVFGLPGEAVKLGAALHVLPPEEIANLVSVLVQQSDKSCNRLIESAAPGKCLQRVSR